MSYLMRAQTTACLVAAVALGSLFTVTSAHADSKKSHIRSSNPYLNSTILKSGRYHTLVPKHCVLHLPERHKNRLGKDSSGSYLPWRKFLANNYGWLTTQDVSLEIAKGQEELSEEKLKRFEQNGKVVLATYKKNLISVRKTTKSSTEK